MGRVLRQWIHWVFGTFMVLTAGTSAWAETQPAPVSPELKAPKIFDRVRALPKKRMLRQGRVELSAQGSLGIADTYYHIVGGSAAVTVYPFDTWGIALTGMAMAEPEPSSNLDLVRHGLLAQPADYSPLHAGVLGSVVWVPVVGKLSVMDQSILYFDTFVSLGGGVVWNQGRDVLPAVEASVGQHFVIADWLTMRVQLRELLYQDRYQFMGDEREALRSYLLLELGLGLFVPPST